MRRRIILAAIKCLHGSGYAATTMTLVASTAGVSRGAMLHHFPTKVDLMLDVVQHIEREHDEVRRDMLRSYQRGWERFIGITEVAWRTMKLPPAQALLEIEMGSRSDPDLAAKIPPIMREIDRRIMDRIWEVASDAGLTNREEVETLSRFNLAQMKGLCIASYTYESTEAVEAMFNMLLEHKRNKARSLLHG